MDEYERAGELTSSKGAVFQFVPMGDVICVGMSVIQLRSHRLTLSVLEPGDISSFVSRFHRPPSVYSCGIHGLIFYFNHGFLFFMAVHEIFYD